MLSQQFIGCDRMRVGNFKACLVAADRIFGSPATQPTGMGDQPGDREESLVTSKSYDIPKTLVWEAWLHVKANQGSRGDANQ